MPPSARSQAELIAQRTKLANSYNELIEELSSKDLRTVGNYTLGRLVGKGSFGKVYLASHKLTNGSKVVLKSAKKDDPNLAREIHHHRQFLHPHIVRLYEVIVTESLVWLVLEYIPGDELYNHLLKTGPMDPVQVQKIFAQLVGAVSYVHGKSCVHRDLKLENILLDKQGNVKLVDFGFTREYEGRSSYLQTWCGTVCYSAPEMLKGEKYAGEKVDVWSLGIILYTMLCGELPFDDDNENETKMKILKEEPKYPEMMPQGAKDLAVSLLSKRPLLRPSLADILQNPWLADHAPQQQAILKLQQPPPFTTDLEKQVLSRMRSAGVDIDLVVGNVLAQRCDSFAGWWALLLQKEERKAKRRERRRKERESDSKSLRRVSAASSRLERVAPTIKEIDEEGHVSLLEDTPKVRGRKLKRNSTSLQIGVQDLPRLPELKIPELEIPPPPIEKSPIRSFSNSHYRLRQSPIENKRSRTGIMQMNSSNSELLTPNGFMPKQRRHSRKPFINPLASIKRWLKESARRARSPGSKSSKFSSPRLEQVNNAIQDTLRISEASSDPTGSRIPTARISSAKLHTRPVVASKQRISSTLRTTSKKRHSISPSPLTPCSYRRSSTGPRGRRSNSSSISSIRSLHHHHSHSKASSTSSISVVSPTVLSATSKTGGKSPQSSTVKVLPPIPTLSVFQSNFRVHTIASSPTLDSSMPFSPMPPSSPGLPVFAKRRQSPFKGPMLHVATGSGLSRGKVGDGMGVRVSSNGCVQGRAGSEIIQEEDEEEIEEVDVFSPVVGTGEFVVMEEDCEHTAASLKEV